MTYSYEFRGRKPSANQVYKMAVHAADVGHDKIEIIWGENAIDLERAHGKWQGFGWIKNVSGDDIAQSMN